MYDIEQYTTIKLKQILDRCEEEHVLPMILPEYGGSRFHRNARNYQQNAQCHNFMQHSGTCLRSHAFPFSAVSDNILYNTFMRLLTQVKLCSSNEVRENWILKCKGGEIRRLCVAFCFGIIFFV